MALRQKRRQLHGLVGALGLVAGSGGLVARWYPAGTAIVLMFGIWMVGATLVNVFTDPPGRR
jgi:hypothetical protein